MGNYPSSHVLRFDDSELSFFAIAKVLHQNLATLIFHFTDRNIISEWKRTREYWNVSCDLLVVVYEYRALSCRDRRQY